jgi:hypothetical protein
LERESKVRIGGKAPMEQYIAQGVLDMFPALVKEDCRVQFSDLGELRLEPLMDFLAAQAVSVMRSVDTVRMEYAHTEASSKAHSNSASAGSNAKARRINFKSSNANRADKFKNKNEEDQTSTSGADSKTEEASVKVPTKDPRTSGCLLCGEAGHRMADCPNKDKAKLAHHPL